MTELIKSPEALPVVGFRNFKAQGLGPEELWGMQRGGQEDGVTGSRSTQCPRRLLAWAANVRLSRCGRRNWAWGKV